MLGAITANKGPQPLNSTFQMIKTAKNVAIIMGKYMIEAILEFFLKPS